MRQLTPGGVHKLLNSATHARLDNIEAFAEIDSTNSYLLGAASPPPGRCRVVLTDHQTQGRGRGDKAWVSPPSSGVCVSMAYTFSDLPQELPSLSLAIGAGIARLLERYGAKGIGLKWPNDVLAGGHKLGGILSEVHPSRDKALTVVIGIGLNVDLGNARQASVISSSFASATDLAACCELVPPRRELAAAIIDCLLNTSLQFESAGFAAFLELWRRYDWLCGQTVTIQSGQSTSAGIAQGVDADGALLVHADGTMQRVLTGSVRPRKPPGVHP